MTDRAAGRVAIVGAGQVGTMLGMALREAGAGGGVAEVALFDRDPRVGAASLHRGAGDRILDGPEEVLDRDTVILAIPVPAIIAFLDVWGGRLHPGSFVLDTGSAKAEVVQAMQKYVPEGVHALGGHPLAGTEQPGPPGARAGLLRGAPFALTVVRKDPEALARGRALVRAVGSDPLEIDPQTHDEVVARTSHLPHLIAYALAEAAAPMVDKVPGLAATGFASAVRLAESDPGMVAGFLWANRSNVRAALAELAAALRSLETALDQSPERLAERLAGIRPAAAGIR